MTLHQNLRQFLAEENTRNAVSGKAFSRTGPQNDPLEGGKIREKNANQRSLKLKACGYSWCN